jgi:hypothetical protein
VIDLDLPAALLAHLAVAPANVTVVFAGRDPIFTRAMRSIFRVAGHDDDIALVATTGLQTFAIVPDGLIVQFTQDGDDDLTVVPMLATTECLDKLPWGVGFAQPAIDAVQELLFRRCEPTGRVQ